MANVSTQVKETVYKIARWKGVNEAQEGEASLEMGEAAVMRNFRVTAGGALKKRGGSQTVAGLLSEYTAEPDLSGSKTLKTEYNVSVESWQMYPQCSADSVGNLILSGAAVTVTYDNFSDYIGYYYKDEEAGKIYRFSGVVRTG